MENSTTTEQLKNQIQTLTEEVTRLKDQQKSDKFLIDKLWNVTNGMGAIAEVIAEKDGWSIDELKKMCFAIHIIYDNYVRDDA